MIAEGGRFNARLDLLLASRKEPVPAPDLARRIVVRTACLPQIGRPDFAAATAPFAMQHTRWPRNIGMNELGWGGAIAASLALLLTWPGPERTGVSPISPSVGQVRLAANTSSGHSEKTLNSGQVEYSGPAIDRPQAVTVTLVEAVRPAPRQPTVPEAQAAVREGAPNTEMASRDGQNVEVAAPRANPSSFALATAESEPAEVYGPVDSYPDRTRANLSLPSSSNQGTAVAPSFPAQSAQSGAVAP